MRFTSLICLLAGIFSFGIFFSVAALEKKEVKRKLQKPVVIVTDRSKELIKNTYLQVDLKNTPEAYSSNRLSEVLQKQAGMVINRSGAPGTQSFLSMRGANPEQTGVFLHSIPLQSAWGGPANLEYLPLELFETAQVYRSYTPSSLAGSHIGGSLNLIPILNSYEPKWLLRQSLSSLYGVTQGIGYTGKNQLHYIEGERTANRYDYVNDNGTIYNTNDDHMQTRQNEDVDRIGYTGFTQFAFGKVVVKNLLDLFYRERGIPGPVGLPLLSVRQENKRVLERVILGYKPGSATEIEFHAGFTAEHQTVHDSMRELSFTQRDNERQYLRPDAGGYVLSRFFDRMLQTRSSVQYSFTHVDNNAFFTAQRSETELGQRLEFRPKYVSLMADGKLQFVQDSNRTASKTSEKQYSEQKNTLPTGYARAGIFPAEFLNENLQEALCAECAEVYISAGYSERRPSLLEIFGDGLTTLPSENLMNEKAITNSAGVVFSGEINDLLLALNFSAFLTGMQNLILFTANSQRTMIAVNAGKAQIAGFESEITLQKHEYFRVWLKYAWLEAIDYSDIPYYNGKHLPNRPRHIMHTGAEFIFGPARFFSMLNYQGANYLDRYNSYYNYLERRFFVSAGISLSWGNILQHKAVLTFKNMLNEKNPDLVGYPLPGRHAEIHVSLSL